MQKGAAVDLNAGEVDGDCEGKRGSGRGRRRLLRCASKANFAFRGAKGSNAATMIGEMMARGDEDIAVETPAIADDCNVRHGWWVGVWSLEEGEGEYEVCDCREGVEM